MSSFSIKDDMSSNYLTIYLPPKETWGRNCENWVEVEVKIKAGGFGGIYKTELTTGDLHSLLPELRKIYKKLSGRLKFDTLEQQLAFKITGDGRGHFEAECEAWESFMGNRLIFTLKFDQTHIARMIRELEEMLA